MSKYPSFIYSGASALIGLGIAWVGLRIIRNENRILYRQIELEEALNAKRAKERRRFLLGK
tara:strand:- start:190 stop:372 length:183 start_codon:yes stop_codon:yes gene_type:complete